MNASRVLLLVTILLLAYPAQTHAQATVPAPLQRFEPLVGKTWRGTFTNASSDRPMEDVSRWEWALNGQAIRILHSLNRGEYGGETIIMWDKEKETYVFFCFTTGGFYTHGTMTYEDGKFISHEKVTGDAGGVTEVRATAELLPDGRLVSSSKFLKDGEWVDGHSVTYVEDPSAEVIFKSVQLSEAE